MNDVARTHAMFHDNVHGAGESFEAVDYEYYTNANGAQLRLRIHWHLTVTGNGTVALERLGPWECIGGWGASQRHLQRRVTPTAPGRLDRPPPPGS